MRLNWLSLSGFRSYDELDWSPEPETNLLVGPNGAGKTNVLEAVSYLSTLRSFRSVSDHDLVGDEHEEGVIRAGIQSPASERLIEIALSKTKQRRSQVDKNRLIRTSDLLGVVRVVAFLPEDIDLIKRGPALRRQFLDDAAVQLWPSAALDQSEFERALRQRNAFLKAGIRDEATLSVWDSRMAQSGGRVLARRAAVIRTLAPYLTQAYSDIAQKTDQVTTGYRPSWEEEGFSMRDLTAASLAERLVAAMAEARTSDYERRLTTRGPHRDEPSFLLNTFDTRTHGSQGEQRSVALSVKLALHRAIREAIDEPPVLLLDDVFSELDIGRAKALASSLPEGTQTMITSARREDVPVKGVVWAVEGGLKRSER